MRPAQVVRIAKPASPDEAARLFKIPKHRLKHIQALVDEIVAKYPKK